MPRAALFVLGMHRSGTSCLTGCLEQAGLFLGEVSRKNPFNKKGNNENIAVMRLNDAVLAANGAAWNDPPDIPLRWTAKKRAERDHILTGYDDGRVFGIKDPRMLLTLDGWLEALPDARFVGTFRHPVSVAQSLRARGDLPEQLALDLWLHYNRKLLDICARRDVPLICFDWPPARYAAALTALCGSLGLVSPVGGFEFFEARLRTHEMPRDLPASPALRETYQALLARAVTPADI